MLEDLKNKAENWTPEMADTFHNNIPRVNPIKGGYTWLTQADGFYHWGPDAVDFYRHDGMIFSVQKKWYTQDWDMHRELYKMSVTSGEFRISEPINYQNLQINDQNWTYTEIQYPGKSIGYPGFFINLLNDSNTTALEYINDLTIMLKYFKLLTDQYDCGYPSKVKIGNRLQDDQGFFWKDIKYWGNTRESFIRKHLGEVQKLTDHVQNNNLQLSLDIVEYARSQWAE